MRDRENVVRHCRWEGGVVVGGKEFNECNVLAEHLSVPCLCTGVNCAGTVAGEIENQAVMGAL